MSGLYDLLVSIGTQIKNIPLKLQEIFDTILSLPEKIFDFIKGLFMPDEESFSNKINTISSMFDGIGVKTYNMGAIFGSEKEIQNVTATFRGKEVTFVDLSSLEKVLKVFRPIIRGVLWLFLLLYNFNQLCGLLGQPGISIAGKVLHGEDNKGGNNT